MAAEAPSMPANGNYGHHGYGMEQQHNPYASQQNFSQGPPSTSSAPTTNGQNSDIPKDEVGWYFVEQYYTTLSKNPEHLYLYYNKRSQFVSGDETAKVQVCVGQRAINDRIKELKFQDCKVRITNVDSQASDHNIVIQVIGEISNKSQPHRKFTQTFVLATQTNGYFVLNDIFRYIIEEEDEVEPQTAEADVQAEETHEEPAVESALEKVDEEPKTLTSSTDTAAVEHDAKEVDQKIEEKLLNPNAEVNGTHKAEPEAESVESKQAIPEEPERPTEPEPTPAASPPKQTPVQPAAQSKPAVPKSWAALAAGAHKVATPKQAPAPAASQAPSADPKPTTSAPAPAATNSAPSAPANSTSAAPAQDAGISESQDEWTAVGSNHNRQQSRQVNGQQLQQQQQQQHQQQQPQQPQPEGPQRKAYIKNVQESVQTQNLKELLEKFGKVSHVDVSRQKNCAFVDFETPEGYQAAVAANPHTLGSDTLYVEERKVRPGNAPFNGRGGLQGGRGGRGDFRGGRGGFNPRGRGQGAARGARGGTPQP